MENTIVKFDYTKEGLEAMKQEFSLVNIDDKEQLNGAVKILVKARGIIQKQGKTFRDEANAYNKSVLEKEKEYVNIIEPLEIKYKERIIEIEKEEVRQERLKVLPQRQSLLGMLKTIQQPSDETILSFDDTTFMTFLSEKQSEDKQNIDREEARLKREQEIADNAKVEAERNAQEQIKKAQQEADAKIAEAELKIEREKQAEIKRQEEEEKAKVKAQEELEKNQKYTNFLKENGVTEENKSDFIIKENDKEFAIYKKIATLEK